MTARRTRPGRLRLLRKPGSRTLLVPFALTDDYGAVHRRPCTAWVIQTPRIVQVEVAVMNRSDRLPVRNLRRFAQ